MPWLYLVKEDFRRVYAKQAIFTNFKELPIGQEKRQNSVGKGVKNGQFSL